MFPEHLKNRALMLKKARSFFEEKKILEVDCGALVKRAPIDSNIDVISAYISHSEQRFLHTSPEYAMKKLLSQGSGDIYFLGHVFRKEETGRLHSPEFTMAEWYRIGFSLKEMMEETSDFLSLFLGPLSIEIISYREAFQKYAQIDYTKDSLDKHIPHHATHWSRLEGLHYILSHIIEPNLGTAGLTFLCDYPPYEAALACLTEKNGETVAERFEIYHKGVELANGYHELSNGKTLRDRFEKENQAREKRNQEPYLLDEEFLSSLNGDFPPCCGVSVGFDRAFMLQQNAKTLKEVIYFS